MSVIINEDGTITVSMKIDGSEVTAAADALSLAISSDVAALLSAKNEVLAAIAQANVSQSLNLPVDLAKFMRGYISGCGMSAHAAAPTTKVAVDAGVLTADDGSAVMLATAGVIDFAASGENGIDQGQVAGSQWYHCFVIGKEDGSTARLASLSLAAPSLPTGYVRKRRIGSQKTNASGALIKLNQRGFDFFWDIPVNDYGASNPGTAPLVATLSVPTGVSVKADCSYYLQSADVTRRSSLITSTGQAATAPAAGVMSTIAAGLPSASGLTQTTFQAWTNTSGQIRHQLDGSGGSTSVFITTRGWFDPL